MALTGSCVLLRGSTFIVCQRGPLLLPNKACVLSAFGDHFNLYGILISGDGTSFL